MDLAEAQKLLPKAAPLRKHLKALVDPRPATRGAALAKLDAARAGKAAPKLSKATAHAYFRVGTELAFPAQQLAWHDTAHEVLWPLVEQPRAELAPLVPAVYPRVSSRAQCALLAMLGATGTRAAATAFVACVREHGWPRDGVYGRVFTELANLLPHGDVLYPALVELAGKHLSAVTDVLVTALVGGELHASKLDLEPLAPRVITELTKALARTAKQQKATGTAWRFADKYAELRQTTGAWLDIAGHLQSPKLTPLLKQALRFADPKLVGFAALALVRRGTEVAAASFARVAASHECRTLLYVYLESLDRLDLFPAAQRTWEAFAACEMVEWLAYPSELGREPDALEHMAALTSGRHTVHVWRFRVGKEPWKAGISGPYEQRGTPVPQHGTSTFSRFELWDSATPEEHAEAILSTLASWEKSKRAKGKGKGKPAASAR